MQAGEGATGGANARGLNGGRFDFDDGGTYCGGWEEGKAHGHGVCTGPKGQGAYSGSWHYGFEVSGVYTWPSGSTFEGQWQNGKRHGLGVETRGRWLYRGEWTQGFKGRYGVRQSATSNAKYEGTWANGLQDGYGSETYADGGTYQGQWLRGMRHGYGVRASAPFGLASHYRGAAARGSLSSLAEAEPAERRDRRVDDARGGFVLKARSDEPPARRNSLVEKTKKGFLTGLKIKKQRSTGELEKRGTGGSGSIRSAGSSTSWLSTESSHSGLTNASLHTDSNASFVVEDEHLDASVTETYMGEWKNDKRTGFGVSERSDGLKYEGEWFSNRKYGYGVTTFRDGTREEGKYKNNVLITSQKRKHLFLIRSAKFRERIDAAVNAAQRASKIALQKADIAISRTATARGKAEQADSCADQAKEDCDLAQMTAKQFAPDFKQPGLEKIRLREKYRPLPDDAQPGKSILHAPAKPVDHNTNPNINQNIPQVPQPTKPVPASRKSSVAYPKTVQPPDSKYSNPAFISNNIAHNSTLDDINEYKPMVSQDGQSQLQNNYPPQTTYQQNLSQQIQPPSNYPLPQPYQQPAQNYPQRQLPQNNYLPYQAASGSTENPYQQKNDLNQPQYSNQAQPSGQLPAQAQGYAQQPRFNQDPLYQQNNPNMMNSYPMYNQNPQEPLPDAYPNRPDQSRIPISNVGGPQPNAMMNDPYAQGAAINPEYMTRRNSRQVGERPPLTNQTSIDHFDHYKRPPSRDSSVDRYARATGRMSISSASRQPSVDKTSETPDRMARGASQMRSATPVSQTGNGMVMTGRGSGAATPVYNVSRQQSPADGLNQPFEDVLLRKRNLGQDIIPSMTQPKRTESLYIGSKVAPPPPGPSGGGMGGGGGGGGGGGVMRKMAMAPQPIQRKKSLPDVQVLPRATEAMSREEVSALGSARREEVRRMAEENERLRANPLLYLVSPQVKDWFSRQQLVMLVLFINISLAIMFFKLLT